ncbi:MAG: UDP-N-acetylmuramoyl-L-alanyl-D-glutamate--2,6-diaminopimelate ligase [Gammaproteobacteria bacterium]
MNLSALLKDFAPVSPGDDRVVAGVAMDHRQVAPGNLFLACAGGRSHGLEWSTDAVERGANSIAWEPAGGRAAPSVPPGIPAYAVERLRARAGEIAARFYDAPSQALDVIGVTGTNGKTSVTHLVANALARLGRRCGVLGTIGYGFPGHLASADRTTPDAVSVQRLLRALRDDGAEAAAIEVSSHALDQARVDAVRFRVAVFTNLTRDHLDYHADIAHYGRAKRRLFELPKTAAGVFFTDDPYGLQLARALGGQMDATAVGAAGGPGPAPRDCAPRFVEITDLDFRARGSRIGFDTHVGETRVETALMGRFNADNLALSLAVLLELGYDASTAADALSVVPTVPGRMEAFGGTGGPLVIVDYAHTPDALEQVLRAARAHAPGRLVCVFGCGGERDRGKRALMSAVAAAWADESIVTDDNPRGEDPDEIVAGIVEGFPAAARWRVQRDRASAIREAIDAADDGDVVVVAGKGHEDYQVVGARVHVYSDRATVASILAGRVG